MKNIFLFLSMILISSSLFATDSLTLPQAIQEGIEHSPYLKLQEKNIQAKEADLRKAWAPIYPTLQLEAGRLRQSKTNYFTEFWKKKFDATGNPGVQSINTANEQNHMFWDIGGRVNVFRGFGDLHNVKEKNRSLEAAQFSKALEKNDLIYNIIETYIEILNLENTLSYITKAKKTAQEEVQNLKKRYEVQLSPKTEVERAEETLLETEWKEAEANQALEIAEHHFNQLLGRETYSSLKTVPLKLKTDLEIKDLKYYLDKLSSNLNIQKLRTELEKDKFKRRKTYAQHLLMPNVAFEYNYEERGRAVKVFEPGWKFGFVTKIPLFDGLKNSGDYRKAQALFESTQVKERLTTQSVEIEIKRNYYEWHTKEKQIAYLNKKRARQQGTFEKTRKALDQKAATITQLHVTEVDVLETETELINKHREQFLNYVALQKLIGEMNHEELIRMAFKP